MKSMKKKRQVDAVIFHLCACVIGFLMIYPMLWLLASSFKSNETMFTNTYSLIPEVFDAVTNYKNAWEGVAGVSFLTFLGNTVLVTVVAMVGCVFISLLAAYAFTRIKFYGVPQYIILKKMNLIDTRIALILPWFFGTAFFIFMLVQFFRGIPKELDEAAEIDGCGKIGILIRILVPVVKPALMTASIFAFYWIWQDFFQPLIFMNTTEKFTLSLALNLFLDPNTYNNYGALFAMSLLSLIPALVIFIIFQSYLVEGIAMDGIKG